jgi:hypothetical protein
MVSVLGEVHEEGVGDDGVEAGSRERQLVDGATSNRTFVTPRG